MFIKKVFKGFAIIATSTIFSMSTIQSAYAAPGALATAPLFLSTLVEPNVFFTLDDSGSMDYELVVEESTNGIDREKGLPTDKDDKRIGYLYPGWTQLYTARTFLPPSDVTGFAAGDKYWVFRHNHGNKLYYDPAIEYTPWPGTNADGTPMFTDADPTAARKDPVFDAGLTVDLTATHTFIEKVPGPDKEHDLYLPTYYTWTDTDGDGEIEDSDAHTKVVITNSVPDRDKMQNFANWWVYYRSRMNTTKAAIGAVINNTDATRMGLQLFNGPATSGVGTPELTALDSMSDVAKKRAFLRKFYEVKTPADGTPGRKTLETVGKMFANPSSGAIFDKANGGECQQNFNIYVSDGFWSEEYENGDNETGNADANNAWGPTAFDGKTTESNDGGNYADDWSSTLADVAMRFYENDLRPLLGNKVPTQNGVDEASHQHLVTYTIAFGINGDLDPLTDDPLDVDPVTGDLIAGGFPGWPNPYDGDSQKVDDMWHAAYNARGQYLNAQNPKQFEDALTKAIANIAERTATAAAVSINSAKLTTDSTIYLAKFNTNRWQGDLEAFQIANLDTGELANEPKWSAAEKLIDRNLTTSPRVMLTYNGNKGVPFEWSKLTTSQKDDLRTNATGGQDSDVVAKARLQYLRGHRTDEGGGYYFRERLSRLGDLVNSGPVFVGSPNLRWPDETPFPSAVGKRYSDFKNGPAAARAGVIYAGANDGMLHGFNEADGEEVIAYFPGNLYSDNVGEGYHYLTEANYVHRYYNDSTPSISDIYDGSKWQTILVSAQRGGGRGVSALNVTDPTAFTEGNANDLVLWEFSNSDDADLGYTYSRPQIGMANNGSWVAIFGNGYNDTGDGEAKLFILDIFKGTDGDWDTGDYREVSTKVGGNTTEADRNGLSTPALADLDGNGTIDRVYAGDLEGNMWAFDLSSTNPGAWKIKDDKPLFITNGNRPITAKPTLAKHPSIADASDGSNLPNVMVFFGSGQYLVNGDKTSTDDEYFYGVWDNGKDELDEDDLVEQTFDPTFTDARVLSNNAVDYAGGKHGWFFELIDIGERSVTNAVVRGGLVFFNSFVPVIDPCSVGGYGYRFAVDMITGGSPDEASVDVNGDGVIDENDQATSTANVEGTVAAIRQEGFLPEPVFIEDISFTAETPSKVIELDEIPKGRFAWQELLQ